jgi:hypothetical protein
MAAEGDSARAHLFDFVPSKEWTAFYGRRLAGPRVVSIAIVSHQKHSRWEAILLENWKAHFVEVLETVDGAAIATQSVSRTAMA